MFNIKKCYQWLLKSNRPMHLKYGVLCGLLGGIMCTFGAAMGMEYKDRAYGGDFDWLDIVATMLGGVPGGLIRLYILTLIF
jgi:hypothetical protein